MSVVAFPGTSVEVTATGLETGLVGTLTVAVGDGQGNTITAATTSGIVEWPAGSGVYTATITAPDDAGEYVVAFDDGSRVGAAKLTVNTVGGTPLVGDLTEWAPGVDNVGAILRARTLVNGAEVGTFTSATRPNADQVADLLAGSVGEVDGIVAGDIPARMHRWARDLAALRTAVRVERTFYPREAALDGSVAQLLADDYADSLDRFESAVRRYVSAHGAGPGGIRSVPVATPATIAAAKAAREAAGG